MLQDRTETIGGEERRMSWPRVVWSLGLTLLLLLIFLVTLMVTIPVTFITRLKPLPPVVEAVAGTVWQGHARLAGDAELDWKTNWDALFFGNLRMSFHLKGPQTFIDGVVRTTPLTPVGLYDVKGRAGPELMKWFPALASLDCSGQIIVDINHLSWSRRAVGAQGELRLLDPSCAPTSPAEVPELRAELTTRDTNALATIRLPDDSVAGSILVTSDRYVKIRIEPSGLRLIPGIPSSAPTLLELPF